MFEDFRKQAEEADFPEETQAEQPVETRSIFEGNFLGMTPLQRFIIAVILLFMTIILGILILMVTSRIVFPIPA